MPGFAPSGAFPSLGRVVRSALLGRLPLARACQRNRPPDRCFRRASRALAGLCRWPPARPCPARNPRGSCCTPWLRSAFPVGSGCATPADRPRAILARNMRRKALAVAALAIGFRSQARARGFELNQGFSGFSDFDPASDYAATFAASLRSLGPKTPDHVPSRLCGRRTRPSRPGDDESRGRTRVFPVPFF